MVPVEDGEETLAARLRSWDRETLVSALVQADAERCSENRLDGLEHCEDVARWRYSECALEELVEAVIGAIEDTNDEADGVVLIDPAGLYRVAFPRCPVSQAPCADYRESCAMAGCCWVKA